MLYSTEEEATYESHNSCKNRGFDKSLFTMKALRDIIQRCHKQHNALLRQRRTVVTPILHKDAPYHFIVRCARGCPVKLYDLEQAHISFMPIGHAPESDHPSKYFGGERFLKRQGTRDWRPRCWFASWGIQIYTGTPSGLDDAQWHDLDFKYDAISAAPDAVLACIERLVNAVTNPLLTLTNSGGLRFSCRVLDYLHPNTESAKAYIHKHIPTAENPYHRDVYLEILGDRGHSRWDTRYEILLGNLLDPPTMTKEILFTPIDALRDALHEPAPPAEDNSEPVVQETTTVQPVVAPVDEKVIAIREGTLSPLAIKRPTPVLSKLEHAGRVRGDFTLHVLEHDEKTGWLCAVDETDVPRRFAEMRISKGVLDAWRSNAQGSALRNFAKALLNALENKIERYENPAGRVRMTLQAFEAQAETLIQQISEEDLNRTVWHQLKHFFQHYPRDADAPMIWDQGALRFWVPVVPNGKKTLPDKVGIGELESGLSGNRVFQIRTGIYSPHEILNYENSWEALELSEIARRFFSGIGAEIERDPNVQHLLACSQEAAAQAADLTLKENVRTLIHIKRAIHVEGWRSAFEMADVIWIVGAPHWPPHLMWKQARILLGDAEEPLCYDVEFNPYCYTDERIQRLYEQNIIGTLTQVLGRTRLNRLSNKTVVLLTGIPVPGISNRPETLLFDWEDFEIAGGLDKLPEVIATRERFERDRDTLTPESSRQEVERVLGCSARMANYVRQRLRGGNIPRVSFQEQILTLLSDGEKRKSEITAAMGSSPQSVGNELKRLVDMGEIVKVRRGVYALPKKRDDGCETF